MLVLSVLCYGQSGINETNTTIVEMTSYELSIIQESYEFYYSIGYYTPFQPDYKLYRNPLAALQARSDNNFHRINREWGKLTRVKLINLQNVELLNQWQNNISNYMYNSGVKYVDLSFDENARQIISYITQPLNIGSIKNELILLQKINNELYRIKNKDPDNFYNSKRYTELGKAINELKNCDPAQINQIGWKYGLI